MGANLTNKIFNKKKGPWAMTWTILVSFSVANKLIKELMQQKNQLDLDSNPLGHPLDQSMNKCNSFCIFPFNSVQSTNSGIRTCSIHGQKQKPKPPTSLPQAKSWSWTLPLIIWVDKFKTNPVVIINGSGDIARDD
ncbi:hypothetical protein Pyn_09192 [Prunus yedoensis var. nudiflora]|uniref:Uncharacterized protein n=1 Tax=Prunus yedoensis var. nudiflora TaxID=2094558 RepID=A0A314XUQ9_PRUYE|nr:hypothetical protein Pyn_09192 [Prunus yedoensis var. nudiflora]